MKKLIAATAAFVAAGALVLAAVAPANAGTVAHTAPGSIVDVAVAASGGGTPDSNPGDYDILIQALTVTGLVPVLADTSTKFTVFAPNDRAFALLVTDLTGAAPVSEAAALTTITGAFTVDQIKNILLYHVVAGKALSPVKVIFAGKLTMANGGIVKPRLITLRDESPTLKDPKLVLKAINIKASNGVIHTIDRVLVPGS
ncbi:fasciclin domain-containing protein [Leifsonia sp. YIM 134122]|uniref:Fasciclin domain-containing protein n=1 Tax=Leifsonia stereocauli TaxID=3134136 RepID=A0ABU9W5F0_9MICO